ncbi:hypothetical protein SASPL_141299 [Salvia splendens]|uniref:Gfo/Idh/MocA-like oxidoreductase N-terminal domain-containing protein n=1 Tax=Salvia splendens TaxID=180675 RepID=A0A8X8WS88_SALSN|nr:hypothetical protein SASPL_141299 [Salvia splendens]
MAEKQDPIRFGIMGCTEIATTANCWTTLLDAVYMPLSTTLHLKWALMAAQKGKHLLLEKPTALDVKVLDEMLESCGRNGLQFMDGSMWYHHLRTAKMKELLSDSHVFGQLDALGALSDAGWYCIGAILWSMNQKLPTTVTALPNTVKNSAGVILTCSASMLWDEEETVATFFCSFLAHETMCLAVSASNGTLNVDDFIIPYEETAAGFSYTLGAKFANLHIGWNMKPQHVRLETKLPQEALMIQEFSGLVKGVKYLGARPDTRWAETSRCTQLVMDAVKNSIDYGYKAIKMHLNGDPCRGRGARAAYLSEKTPILTARFASKLHGNALGEGAVVRIGGSFVLPLVLDEENPTESAPASWLDLKVSDRSREIEPELGSIRLLLSSIDMLIAS